MTIFDDLLGDEQTDDDVDMSSWTPIDLGPAWRGDKMRPIAVVLTRDDGVALLLPGVNYMFGDSGDGKSLVAAIAALQEVRAGRRVIWATYEDANEDELVDRLKLLGATEEEGRRVLVITPQTTLTRGIDRLVTLAGDDVRLVVVDSVGEAMAVGGINEDKDNEVGPWFRSTVRRLHELNPELAMWPIDHATKSKDNPLFPSGSKRKRAAVTGRCFLLNVRQPFGREQVGYVQLIVAKDRGGTFRRGDIAAEIMLDATVTPYRVAVTAPRTGDSYTAKVKKRNADERVREVLSDSAVALTAAHVARIANGTDRVRAGESDLNVKTVQNVLTKMASEPDIRRELAPIAGVDGKPPSLWRMVRPDEDIPT